jgi:hypothetical protein
MMQQSRFQHAITWLRARSIGMVLVAAVLVLAGVTASSAAADTQTFGSDLSAVPTLDTANGAYGHTAAGAGSTVISPNPHDATDTSIWNASGPGVLSAPAGGQILAIKLEGCAREDTSAPEQTSLGVAVNEVGFQPLAPSADGSETVEKDLTVDTNDAPFTLPFCSDSSNVTSGAVNTSTVTTFTPLHACVDQGWLVDFHDIGGYVPPTSDGKGPWYPQGVPFDVIAAQQGSSLNSFIAGAALPGAVYSPTDTSPTAGWGSESGEELQMQVVLGTGGDAYSYCPGGSANEPANSNQVICDQGAASDGHPQCTSGTGAGTGTGTKGGGTGTKGGGTGTKGGGTGTKGGGTGTKGSGTKKGAAPTLGAPSLSHTLITPSMGLSVRYSDSVAGATKVKIVQEQFGRKSGTSCVTKPDPKLRHSPVCRLFVTVEVVRHRDAVGRNRVRLSTGELAAGSYRLEVVSTFGRRTSRMLLLKFHVRG